MHTGPEEPAEFRADWEGNGAFPTASPSEFWLHTRCWIPGSQQLHEIGCVTSFSHQKHFWHRGQGVTFPQGIRGAHSPLPWQKMLPLEQLRQGHHAEFNTGRPTAVPSWQCPAFLVIPTGPRGGSTQESASCCRSGFSLITQNSPRKAVLVLCVWTGP